MNVNSSSELLLPALALAALLAGSPRTGRAESDFRIANRVFAGDSDQPSSESLTIFQAGLVYDFLEAPEETTIFDADRGRFVILDPARRVRTEISTNQVEEFSAQLKRRVVDSRHPLLAFLAEPKFEELHSTEGRLELSSQYVVYKAQATKVDADAAATFKEYADWQAQLNVLINPNSLPPFARLSLNRALAQRQYIPDRIELKTWSRRPLEEPQVRRSEHNVQWRLIDDDHRRVDEANGQLASFELVSLADYHRRELAATGR